MPNGSAGALCFIGMAVFYLLYQRQKHRPSGERALALTFKGLATLCAAALAIYGAVNAANGAHGLLAAGLLICVAADVLLGVHFLAGMAVFALGHACYSIAYILEAPPTWISLIAFVVLAAFCLIRYPALKKYAGSANPLPYLGYALVLCGMLALAVTQKPLLLCGALLFVLSDALLARRIMLKIHSVPYDYVCLGCYYLAQFLIAASTLV